MIENVDTSKTWLKKSKEYWHWQIWTIHLLGALLFPKWSNEKSGFCNWNCCFELEERRFDRVSWDLPIHSLVIQRNKVLWSYYLLFSLKKARRYKIVGRRKTALFDRTLFWIPFIRQSPFPPGSKLLFYWPWTFQDFGILPSFCFLKLFHHVGLEQRQVSYFPIGPVNKLSDELQIQ